MGKRIAAMVVVLGAMAVTATVAFFGVVGFWAVMKMPIDTGKATIIAITAAAIAQSWTLAGVVAEKMK